MNNSNGHGNGEVILRMRGITKTFPGVTALKDVTFDQRKGEIHALVGENGAGKSTLMKILGGAYLPDEGSIEINGEIVDIKTPRDALDYNISIIYQEFNLVPTLSIAENIFLGKELVKSKLKNLDRKAMIAQSKQAIGKLGLNQLDFGSLVRNLSIAQRQMVEIGKSLFNNASILVMDEPTSVLSQKETAALFQLIKGLRQEGISIVYISHRIEEVMELSDRITVIRDGEIVCTLDNSGKSVTKEEIVRHMVGRSLKDYFPERKAVKTNEKLLEVKGFTRKDMFHDISFDLYRGEILGFYGLVGAGRTEIMKSIFSSMEHNRGEILLGGKKIEITSVDQAIKQGIALVPEDRKREGLVLKMTLAENICLPNLDAINTGGTIRKRKKKALVDKYLNSLSINPPLPNRLIKDFSGGNQQKAVIAKWLATNPKIMILDEPTRGVDVGAKTEIYKIIEELSERGVGIVFVSSELMEIIGMCDRVIVIHEGKITGRFDRSETTQEKLMHAAAGF